MVSAGSNSNEARKKPPRPRDLRGGADAVLLPESTFRLHDVLMADAGADGLVKSERTLLRLKAAAAAALETIPYQTLRVADVAKEAGVSHALFYHYFRDKEQMTIEVLSEMLRRSELAYRGIHAFDSQYETLFVPNLFYLELYRRNAGLFRASLTLADEVDAFRTLWNEAVDRWHRRIAAAIRAYGDESKLLPDAELTAYGIGGMIDHIGRLVFVQANPFIIRLASDVVHLAETVTILWFRAVHGADPDIDDVMRCRAHYGRR